MDIQQFVKDWVGQNVFNIPGLEDPSDEIARLASKLIADAAAVKISIAELEDEIGDLTEYMEVAYMKVYDPVKGFRNLH